MVDPNSKLAEFDRQLGGFDVEAYEEKWGPKQDLIDKARAEAEAKGLTYSGDATSYEKLKEFIKNAPDAAYSFMARGAEGFAEIAVGLGLATMKAGQLATTTDPERLKQIAEEPAFTKYLGEFRGDLGELNLAKNDRRYSSL